MGLDNDHYKTADVETPNDGNIIRLSEQPVAIPIEEDEGRDRWTSRTAFILAAIGSAIGLGNFWRFPYLLYKHGGGVFLIPYTLALFVVGIPLLQLEITLGQVFQKGNAQALAKISPKMTGIGYAAAFSAFSIVSYYVMIISWVLIYFVQSFRSDLPWAGESDCLNAAGKPYLNAEYYLYHELLGVWKKTANGTNFQCSFRDDSDSDGIQWATFGSMICVWCCVYFCVFKGAHHTSKVVYVTVLLPVFILFVLFFRAVTLDGAGMGIDAYIANWDLSRLQSTGIWVDAISQVFFSLSLSSAVMVSFGSYNKRGKPILADSFIIALSNSFFSIISGFVVWSTLGFYAKSLGLTSVSQLDEGSLKSLGLVFITYPLALSEIPGTNFWCVILFLNLFMLGIDSAFSLVEGFFAVIEDTPIGKRVPRPILLLITIVPCCLLGIFYCQDTGLYWFDEVDHMIQYVMLLSGSLQCFAVGWARGTLSSVPFVGRISSYLYGSGYVFATVLLITLTVTTANSFRSADQIKLEDDGIVSWETLIGLLAFFITFSAFSIFSRAKAQGEWLKEVFLTGPMEFVNHWYKLGAVTNQQTGVTIPLGQGNSIQDSCARFYAFYWPFVIKYVIPSSILLLLFVGVRADINKPYGGYSVRYQVLGWTIILIGLCMALFPMIILPFKPRESVPDDDFKVSVVSDRRGSLQADMTPIYSKSRSFIRILRQQ